jgi:hypothetical protein
MSLHDKEHQEITINDRVFYLTKFPAVAGREIITKYPISNTPKLGDYGVSEETMLKLMSFVYVNVANAGGSNYISLNTRGLVDNHTGSWETLVKLEYAMLEYNCSFLQNGRLSTFFGDIAQKLPAWITKILTDSLGQLSQVDKPPSTN